MSANNRKLLWMDDRSVRVIHKSIAISRDDSGLYEVRSWVDPWDQSLIGEAISTAMSDDFSAMLCRMFDVQLAMGGIHSEKGFVSGYGSIGCEVGGIKTRALAEQFADMIEACLKVATFGVKDIEPGQLKIEGFVSDKRVIRLRDMRRRKDSAA